MAVKAVLETLEGLSDVMQKEYKKGDDGKFYLDVEGVENHPNVGALKRAKDREVEESKTLRTQLATLTEERDGMLKGNVPKADVDKLEASYKAKLADTEKVLKSQLAGAESSLNTLLVENVAQRIATEISTSPELLIPHIRGRLKAEIVEGKPFTRVLDSNGALSANSIDDFKKEIIENPVFSPIIISSRASGSSAPQGGSSGRTTSKTDQNLATLSPRDLAAHMAAKKS